MKTAIISSVLQSVIQEVYSSSSLDEGKTKMLKVLDDCKIKDADKSRMKYEIKMITNLTKLQFYCTNAMLKYEGLGIGKPTGNK